MGDSNCIAPSIESNPTKFQFVLPKYIELDKLYINVKCNTSIVNNDKNINNSNNSASVFTAFMALNKYY